MSRSLIPTMQKAEAAIRKKVAAQVKTLSREEIAALNIEPPMRGVHWFGVRKKR